MCFKFESYIISLHYLSTLISFFECKKVFVLLYSSSNHTTYTLNIRNMRQFRTYFGFKHIAYSEVETGKCSRNVHSESCWCLAQTLLLRYIFAWERWFPCLRKMILIYPQTSTSILFRSLRYSSSLSNNFTDVSLKCTEIFTFSSDCNYSYIIIISVLPYLL
jgi:hypothetical protein